MLRKRRWKIPTPDAGSGEEARLAVRDAAQRMSEIIAQQPRVDELHNSLSRTNRENRLVPRITAALGAHGE